MTDSSGTNPNPNPASSETSDDGFSDDPLSELMTGARAATQMVTMSAREELPELPQWKPGDSQPPLALAVDGRSGAPTAVPPPRPVDRPEDPSVIEPLDLLSVGALEIGLSAPGEQPSTEIDVQTDAPAATRGPDFRQEPAATMTTEPGVVLTARRSPADEVSESPQDPVSARGGLLHRELAARRRGRWRARAGRALVATSVLAVVGGAGWWVATHPAARRPSTTQASAFAPAVDIHSVMPAHASAPEPPPSRRPAPPPDRPPAETPQTRYDVAAQRYAKTQQLGALRDMTVSACQLRDGPTARAAFRKLVGSKARREAIVRCRENGIDVTAALQGFTAHELAEQAKDAMWQGKWSEALRLAKKSNRTERNQRALGMIVRAHCELGQKQSAERMMRHVEDKRRDEVLRRCRESGIAISE